MPEQKKNNVLDEIMDAVNWVKSYYGSPGFMERFTSNNNDFMRYRGSEYDPNKDGYKDSKRYYDLEIRNGLKLTPLAIEKVSFVPSDLELAHNAEYNFDDKEIKIGKKYSGLLGTIGDFFNSMPFMYDYVAAHEAGHGMAESIKHILVDQFGQQYNPATLIGYKEQSYTDMLPALRANKMYQRLISSAKYADSKDYINLNPEMLELSEQNHDALPKEGYADLVALRYLMAKHNIYDSKLANNPAEQKHIAAIKKLYPKLRIFKLYDDDQLLYMLNSIAQIYPKVPDTFNTNNHNKTTYA